MRRLLKELVPQPFQAVTVACLSLFLLGFMQLVPSFNVTVPGRLSYLCGSMELFVHNLRVVQIWGKI
jgi:hypothetical protein